MNPIVLASSSIHRRMLMDRLSIPYLSCSPDIDESRRDGESPTAYVQRLSLEKATAVQERFPDALIIGSDQAAVLDDMILGKPGGKEAAMLQLSHASGRIVRFLTGLCLLNAKTGHHQTDVVPFQVHFRQLDSHAIERYLEREQPYDCAGSFKSEGLGITLFQRMEGGDPTALIGLPLIRLVSMLVNEGIKIP